MLCALLYSCILPRLLLVFKVPVVSTFSLRDHRSIWGFPMHPPCHLVPGCVNNSLGPKWVLSIFGPFQEEFYNIWNISSMESDSEAHQFAKLAEKLGESLEVIWSMAETERNQLIYLMLEEQEVGAIIKVIVEQIREENMSCVEPEKFECFQSVKDKVKYSYADTLDSMSGGPLGNGIKRQTLTGCIDIQSPDKRKPFNTHKDILDSQLEASGDYMEMDTDFGAVDADNLGRGIGNVFTPITGNITAPADFLITQSQLTLLHH